MASDSGNQWTNFRIWSVLFNIRFISILCHSSDPAEFLPTPFEKDPYPDFNAPSTPDLMRQNFSELCAYQYPHFLMTPHGRGIQNVAHQISLFRLSLLGA